VNWDLIVAVADIFGSVAVFVTLVYLAVQVRHARTEMVRAVKYNRVQAARELSLARAGNERLAGIVMKANAALGMTPDGALRELIQKTGLSPTEFFLLHHDLQAWWTFRSQVVPFLSELSTAERAEFDSGTRAFFQNPVNRLWYDTLRPTLGEDAVRYVDGLLAPSA